MNEQLYYATRSLCPVCNELVPGRIVPRGQRVFLERTCPRHGPFEGLVCSDRTWYERLPMFFTPGTKPRNPVRAPQKGCPEDCGLCAAHTQIAGTVAIEISNVCNGACPACLANNQGTFELSVAEVVEAVEAVLKNQDHIDTLTLSGGEPTIHPRLFEILAALRRPEIGRVALNSNGIRIAQDDDFVKRLADEPNLYVSLHYDGIHAQRLRGTDPSVQQAAVERLNRHGVAMVPVVLAAQGVNDRELGPIVERLLLDYAAVKGVIVSILAFTGSRGATFPGDPQTRLTIPEALDRIEAGADGRMKKSDFMPLPMPNPMCAAIGYFLLVDGELTPLIPYGQIEQVVAHTKNAHFGKATPEFTRFIRDSIDAIYANPEKYPDGDGLMRKFRKLLDLLFALRDARGAEVRARAAEDLIRVVYLVQFMDTWTFDARRLARCSCQHVLPGGKIVSSCGYYCYHRRFDPRFAAAGP